MTTTQQQNKPNMSSTGKRKQVQSQQDGGSHKDCDDNENCDAKIAEETEAGHAVTENGGCFQVTKRRNETKHTINVRFRHQSSLLSQPFLDRCLELFEDNMAQLYANSSWGLDLKEKHDELSHPDARYVLLFAADASNMNDTSDKQAALEGKEAFNAEELIGFCHFRLEYDGCDMDRILYIYELQIHRHYQGCGIGEWIMKHLEVTTPTIDPPTITKLMLTVFKQNAAALRFYTNRLLYEIDESSPSQHGDSDCDYEILSKRISERHLKRLKQSSLVSSATSSKRCTLS